jgi:hypothetical protein
MLICALIQGACIVLSALNQYDSLSQHHALGLASPFSILEEALMSFSLLVLNGPTPGAKIPLIQGRDAVSIGRHASRDLHIDDDRASRLHAQITYRADRWHVEDCGSLNGTFLNSQSVQQSVLEPGDLIRVADALVLFVDDATDHAVLGNGAVSTAIGNDSRCIGDTGFTWRFGGKEYRRLDVPHRSRLGGLMSIGEFVAATQ